MDLHGAHITWLGHGTFTFTTPAGKSILLDPWVQGNPACPDDKKQLGKLDAILITHGHGDHIGDALSIAADSQPDQVVGIFELAGWLESKGCANTVGMNMGGTIEVAGARVTMVRADHSCGILDGDTVLYGGQAAGYVIDFGNDLRVYVAGDTNVFGDMAIIRDLYAPQIAMLPIGDHYTMSPREAAYACNLLKPQTVIPMHFATFPVLTGRPRELAKLAKNVEVFEMQPGQTAS